ncbi:MAG: NAD(P)-binding protein [Actinobacteria bacterium]|nr:NAD(P)-binding protein [Actinomycetota bacterium]
MSQKSYDAIVVGSGINALVAGAVLSKSGWRVLLCERNNVAGGAIRTEAATLPGFTHELLSSWHPLFVGGPAYAELAEELTKRGVIYKNTTSPTGVVCSAGTAILSTDPVETAKEMDRLGDGAAWSGMMQEFGAKIDLAFGLLGADFWRAA